MQISTNENSTKESVAEDITENAMIALMKEKLKLWGIEYVQSCESDINMVASKVISAITHLDCDKRDGTLYLGPIVPCDDVKGYFGHNGIACVSVGSNISLLKAIDLAIESMYEKNLNLSTAKVYFVYLEIAEHITADIVEALNMLIAKLHNDGYDVEDVPILRTKDEGSPNATVTLIALH